MWDLSRWQENRETQCIRLLCVDAAACVCAYKCVFKSIHVPLQIEGLCLHVRAFMYCNVKVYIHTMLCVLSAYTSE